MLCEAALCLQRDGLNSRFNFGAVVQLKNSKQLKVSKIRDLHNPVFQIIKTRLKKEGSASADGQAAL